MCLDLITCMIVVTYAAVPQETAYFEPHLRRGYFKADKDLLKCSQREKQANRKRPYLNRKTTVDNS